MSTPNDRLFWSDHEVGTSRWNEDVFRLAYCFTGGPFKRVIERTACGFSVLVYLPGNVMRAAAEVLKRDSGSVAWVEHGVATDKNTTYPEIWGASRGLLSRLTDWLGGGDKPQPYAIFHNLDMLNDGHGGLDPGNEAKTALYYLTECSRSGVVVGLSDLAAGPLPAALRRPFDEEVWLEEIPLDRFPALIPRALGTRLADGEALADGPAHLLATRLRWTDPCRAVRIMASVPPGDIGAVLRNVTDHTRSAEFANPATLGFDLPDDQPIPPGYEQSTVEQLERVVIDPYRRWATYTGNAPDIELRRLPPGVVLYGPPGTGKSRLARWMAWRIGIPVRQVGAADLKRADWGLTELLVRELFRSARRASPCMIVLDDADDLLPDRSALQGGLAGAERGVVNAFLQELEGFRGRMEGVLVVLTTNRDEHLDKAAKSRLPLRFRVPYPLNREQVCEIVLEVGRHHGIARECWDRRVLDSLATLFMLPLRPVNDKVDDPGVRRRMARNLFSPREIAAAVRMMIASAGGVPAEGDVNLVKKYYQKLADDEAAVSD